MVVLHQPTYILAFVTLYSKIMNDDEMIPRIHSQVCMALTPYIPFYALIFLNDKSGNVPVDFLSLLNSKSKLA